MDDAFSLVASEMPRVRRLSPFAMRLIAMLAVAVTLLVSFSMFVIGQQRAADARRATLAAHQAVARQAEAQAAVRGSGTAPGADAAAVGDLLDRRAQAAAADALRTAVQLVDASSIEQVAPATLSSANPDLVFVEGPSTAPSIVSVFVGASGWSAAVRGSGHTCYWVAFGPGGHPRYGTGSPCTGIAALAADRAAW